MKSNLLFCKIFLNAFEKGNICIIIYLFSFILQIFNFPAVIHPYTQAEITQPEALLSTSAAFWFSFEC